MAQKRRLSPNQKADLKADLAGLKSIPDYNPTRAEFKTSEIETVDMELDNLDDQIAQTKAHLIDLQNRAADKAAVFTEKMKGARHCTAMGPTISVSVGFVMASQ